MQGLIWISLYKECLSTYSLTELKLFLGVKQVRSTCVKTRNTHTRSVLNLSSFETSELRIPQWTSKNHSNDRNYSWDIDLNTRRLICVHKRTYNIQGPVPHWSALEFSQTFASVFPRLWRHEKHALFLN